jgi:tetratricopeptide (TPR) repeat protein
MSLFSRKRGEPSVITRADRAREAGQWQLAADFYRMALDRNPGNPPIWIQYGHALKECGNQAEAEAAYRTAISYGPEDADAHLQLGHILKIQAKMAQSGAAYRRALQLDSSLGEAARELSELDESDMQPSMELPPAGLAAPPRRSARKFKLGKGSYLSRADRARDARQWDIAAELYRKALDRNPNNPPIWVQYGHALKESGNLAEAESAYRAAIARDPGAAEPHLQLGHVLKMCNRRGEAQTAYLQALALQRSRSEPLSGLESLGWPQEQLAQLRQIAVPANVEKPSRTTPVSATA